MAIHPSRSYNPLSDKMREEELTVSTNAKPNEANEDCAHDEGSRTACSNSKHRCDEERKIES